MSQTEPDHADRRFALRDEFAARHVDGRVFVLMPDSSMHILENDSAVALWRALEEAGASGITVAALGAALTAEFEVEPAAATRDVRAFLATLDESGLVTEIKPPAGG